MRFENSNTYAIILNYNSAEESIALFENLEVQHYKYLRILVIDNNSSEEDQIQLKENIPSENLIFNKINLGYAGGNNRGIEIALNEKADFIWLLNPDIRVESNTLSILLETLLADISLAAVGSRIIHRANPSIIFSDGELLVMDEKCSTIHKNSHLEIKNVPTGIVYDVDYIDGSCILLNCNAIKDVGILSMEYFLYFEETDWCFRARKKKWKIAINSNTSVYNLTSVKANIFHYYFMRNRLIFSKKYHPNFIKVRNYYIKELLREVGYRFRGKYFKPFFESRVKGLVSGIINTSKKK